jgi:putative FmdB family regulatory protein
MSLYDYLCNDCKHEEEEYQSIHANPTKQCPECGSKTWHRVIGVPMLVQVKGGTTTVGALADRNAAKMSKDEMQELVRKHKTAKQVKHELPGGMRRDEREKPEKREWPGQTELTEKVAQMDQEQQKNYMETRDKNG